MRIAVLGAGAIGSMLGMFLQEGGADICLVDPFEDHMKKIAEEGLHFTSVSGESKHVKMKTCITPEEAGEADLIIVLVKGLFTRTALQGASKMIGEKTCVLTCQNGLGQEAPLKEFFTEDRILMGCLGFSSVLKGPGEIYGNINRNPGKVHIYVGCMDREQGPAEPARKVVEYAEAGGLNARYSEDIRIPIWEKAANNVSCNALCGILRVTLGQMYEVEQGKSIHNEILRELVRVGNALGVPLDAERLLKSFEEITYPGVCRHYPSTAQDIFNKKQTEIDFLNGAISRFGKELGIPTPYNDMVSGLVKVIEANYENLYKI